MLKQIKDKLVVDKQNLIEQATKKQEPVVVDKPIKLYRGTSKGSENVGSFYSDSKDYANKFAAAKGGGDIQEVTLPKETKNISYWF